MYLFFIKLNNEKNNFYSRFLFSSLYLFQVSYIFFFYFYLTYLFCLYFVSPIQPFKLLYPFHLNFSLQLVILPILKSQLYRSQRISIIIL